jgi:hypothetical protein
MNTERWHRDTTLMALATSLDRMLAIDYRVNANSRSGHNSSSRKIQSQIATGVTERKRTVAGSFEARRHRAT